MKKTFDIRKTFDTFLKEPFSILTEGLFQIVNINMPGANFFQNQSSFSVDFMNNKKQITVINNDKMYNLFQTVLHKKKLLEKQARLEKFKEIKESSRK